MSTPKSADGPTRRPIDPTLALSVTVVASFALLILLASCSVCLAQQAASVVSPEETLAEKVNDPTANLTQVTIQDLYAPQNTARMHSRTRFRFGHS